MSSGHRKLGKVERDDYEEAIVNPGFQEHWQKGYTINRQFDIPYLGGYSSRGSVIYIDRDFDLDVLIPALTLHEHFEKSCIDGLGWEYNPSHYAATWAEHLFVQQILGRRPADYEKTLRPYIHHCEEKIDKAETRWPTDFDYTPYPERIKARVNMGRNPGLWNRDRTR